MCAGGEEALGEGGERGEREGSKIPHKKGNMSRNRRTRRKRKEEERGDRLIPAEEREEEEGAVFAHGFL